MSVGLCKDERADVQRSTVLAVALRPSDGVSALRGVGEGGQRSICILDGVICSSLRTVCVRPNHVLPQVCRVTIPVFRTLAAPRFQGNAARHVLITISCRCIVKIHSAVGPHCCCLKCSQIVHDALPQKNVLTTSRVHLPSRLYACLARPPERDVTQTPQSPCKPASSWSGLRVGRMKASV